MRFGPYSLLSACLRLALCEIGFFLAVVLFAYFKRGFDSLLAVAVAAVVCGSAATLALLLTGWLRDSRRAAFGMLLATMPRLGIPLVAGVALDRMGGTLAQAGVFGWIVAFYLMTLVVETVLSLNLTPKGTQGESKGIVTHG